MAADESEYLRKRVDPIELATVWADGLDRRHLHDDALNVLFWDYSVAFVAAVLGCFADDLDEAAAAIRTEFFVGDDGQGHNVRRRVFIGIMTSLERPT
jgi:hypothetical protein